MRADRSRRSRVLLRNTTIARASWVLLISSGLLIAARALPAADAKISLKTRPTEAAQQPELNRREIIKVDVELALINVIVTDPMGRMVTGLDKEHFLVREDKKEQEIAQFGAEDTPLSLAVVFDASVGRVGFS